MPTKLRIIIALIVLILIAGVVYLLLANRNGEPDTNSEPVGQTTTPVERDSTEEVKNGEYVDYNAELVSNTQGTRMLFFHAPWCVQCRELEASITSGTIPSDVTIFKVDYDSNQSLRQQYGVTLQTTVVLIDKDGNEIKKYVAYQEPSLDAVIRNLL